MYNSLFVIFIYLSFLVDFLIIPIPSEASTKSLIKTSQSKDFSRFTLMAIFVLNLLFYLFPLISSVFQLVARTTPAANGGLIYLGIVIAILGRLLSIFGGVVLRKNKGSIVSSSIFRWSRNPIALGMHLTLLGLIVFTNQWFLFAGLAFCIWNIHSKIKIEEQHLINKFGTQYTNYMHKTPRYLGI